jgi:hypothetical protein
MPNTYCALLELLRHPNPHGPLAILQPRLEHRPTCFESSSDKGNLASCDASVGLPIFALVKITERRLHRRQVRVIRQTMQKCGLFVARLQQGKRGCVVVTSPRTIPVIARLICMSAQLPSARVGSACCLFAYILT